MDDQQRARLEQRLNRLARGLGNPGHGPVASEAWSVPTDIYETEQEFIVCLELAGVDPADIRVVAEESRLIIIGKRGYQLPREVQRVHQLEIERGRFEKRLSLPWPIVVDDACTDYRHGLLVITLPKQRRRFKIPVSPGWSRPSIK